jgi:hypothetical protein
MPRCYCLAQARITSRASIIRRLPRIAESVWLQVPRASKMVQRWILTWMAVVPLLLTLQRRLRRRGLCSRCPAGRP